MKKKCTAFLIILCLLCSFSSTAFAADTSVYGESSADTIVTYHVDSQYMVYIPETLDLTYLDANNPYVFTAGMMELQDNETVCVKIASDRITLTNSSGAAISGSFNRSDTLTEITKIGHAAEFNNGQTTCNYGIYFTLNGDSGFHAGDFTGTVTFNVSLETN